MTLSRLPFDIKGLMGRIDDRTRQYQLDKDVGSYLAFMREHFNPYVLNAYASDTSYFEDYFENEECIAKIADYAKYVDRLFREQLKRPQHYQLGIFQPHLPHPPSSNDRLKMKAEEFGIKPIETDFSLDSSSLSSDAYSPSSSLLFQESNFEDDELHQFKVYDDQNSSLGLK